MIQNNTTHTKILHHKLLICTTFWAANLFAHLSKERKSGKHGAYCNLHNFLFPQMDSWKKCVYKGSDPNWPIDVKFAGVLGAFSNIGYTHRTKIVILYCLLHLS
jgi:hypothetical protein